MTLEDLQDDVEREYETLGGAVDVDLDRETRNELALLNCALGPDSTGELVRRAVHVLFQSAVETGNLDFHLRSGYDCTYDEYLSGMTYDEMAGGGQVPTSDGDDRRYQF